MRGIVARHEVAGSRLARRTILGGLARSADCPRMTPDQATALVDAPRRPRGRRRRRRRRRRGARGAARSACCTTLEEFADLSTAVRRDLAPARRARSCRPTSRARSAHAGGYVAGAFDASRGAWSAGSFGVPRPRRRRGRCCTPTSPAALAVQSAGVGFALKLHQRAWCLERGIATVTWTFDPLVSRNAYFNLRKLGALATAYGADFYGEMPDAINAGDRTDRLVVRWDAGVARAVAAAAAGPPARRRVGRAAVLLDADDAGRPRPRTGGATARTRRRCSLPRPDGRAGAAAPRPARRRWRGGWPCARRSARRSTPGWVAVDATPDGWYVLASPGREAAREARRGRAAARPHAAGRAVPHVVRHAVRARHPAAARRSADDVEGWGECVAMEAPVYSSEYVEAAAHVTARAPAARGCSPRAT